MHLVALTRWAPARAVDQDLPWLAAMMRLVPYEARLRLNSGTPVVLARGLPLNVAQQSLTELRAHAHGAVVVDEDAVPDAERSFVAGSFELGEHDFIASDRQGRGWRIPYPQLVACVRAVEVTEEERSTETVEKKLALGRAVLTGGLMMKKTIRTSETRKSGEHEQVVYLWKRDVPQPLMLRERTLSYAGLGAERGHGAIESLNRLLAALRARAPHMLFDERLCQRKRRSELASVRGTSSQQTRSSSNAGANDLAAYILVQAHLQEQL